jgi:hypothetical protein
MVLDHLNTYGNITSWEAIMKYRITRLSEYIRQLRSEGFDIHSEWQENEDKRWVKYTLVRKEVQIEAFV